MELTMLVLFTATLLCGTLADEGPISEQQYFKLQASAREATEPVPKNLQRMFADQSVLVTPTVTRLTRSEAAAAARTAAPSSTDAFRPKWQAAATAPPNAAPSFAPPSKLFLNGTEISPAYILGADNRRTYQDTSYPYSTIAKVYIHNGGYCSGVLIGPRHVLTAMHCVLWASPYPTYVEINRAGNTVAASANVVNIWHYTAITTINTGYTLNDVDNDYVVLILSSRLGDRFGYMGSTTYSDSWNNKPYWANLGYPSDISNGVWPTYQSPFSMVDKDFQAPASNLAIQTYMDLISGQSGGPVYAYFNNDPKVVAVASGVSRSSTGAVSNWVGGGADMSNLISSARTKFP